MRSHMLPIGAVLVLAGFAVPAKDQPPMTSAAPEADAVALVSMEAPLAAASPVDVMVSEALNDLSAHVTKQSNPSALRTALEAYFNFKTAHPDEVRKPYLYYIDYGLNNRTARGYVFNMETNELIEGPFIVAHGRGSGPKDAVPMRFSNRHGSAATSLGLYVTQETYNFSGKAGGRYYTSIGLRMSGESGRFNSNARGRGVVVHGAPYVTRSAAGRSEGCPAMEQSRARRLLPLLARGAVVFQYSPHDRDWLQHDPWVNAD